MGNHFSNIGEGKTQLLTQPIVSEVGWEKEVGAKGMMCNNN